jgi:hypothetical protein
MAVGNELNTYLCYPTVMANLELYENHLRPRLCADQPDPSSYLWHLTPAPTPQQDEARQEEDDLEQYTVRLGVNKQLHELVSRWPTSVPLFRSALAIRDHRRQSLSRSVLPVTFLS